jgi:hypothetical protein
MEAALSFIPLSKKSMVPVQYRPESPPNVAVSMTVSPATGEFTFAVNVTVCACLAVFIWKTGEAPPVKLTSPGYVAVMACAPGATEAMLKLATPATSSADPSTAPLSVNVSTPLGVPLPGAAADTVTATVRGTPAAGVPEVDGADTFAADWLTTSVIELALTL